MKRLFTLAFAIFLIADAGAATHCMGKVKGVYKWNNMTTLSMQLLTTDGATTAWINMPTKSDEAMALLALATGRSIDLYWVSADVTACANGWAHNRVLEGYFAIGD